MIKIRLIVLIAIVGIFLLLLAACGEGTSKDALNGTTWSLTAYSKTQPIEGSTLTAEFADGQIRGSAGCNSYSGSYKSQGDKITVSEIAMTLMACMEPEGIMDQEQTFLTFLRDAQTFKLSDGQLQIFRLDGEVLTFKAD